MDDSLEIRLQDSREKGSWWAVSILRTRTNLTMNQPHHETPLRFDDTGLNLARSISLLHVCFIPSNHYYTGVLCTAMKYTLVPACRTRHTLQH